MERDRPDSGSPKSGTEGVISKHRIEFLKNMTKKTPSQLAASDRSVNRWHENMARSSRLNADVRLRRLNLFCIRTKMTPAKLVRMGKKDAIKVEDVLLDHVSWLESQGYAPNYIDGILKSVKAWLVTDRVQEVDDISGHR